MSKLDTEYGRVLPPQPRSISGSAYDAWESTYTPASLIKLDAKSALTMKALVEYVTAECPINLTLVNDMVFIWVVDRDGEIFLAAEELVLDSLPKYIVKHQDLRLTKNENKLGHPALISCQPGRIGGEIKYLHRDQNRERSVWIINNGSGRYGVTPDRTERQLTNVNSRFAALGMKFEIDFIRPRASARVV